MTRPRRTRPTPPDLDRRYLGLLDAPERAWLDARAARHGGLVNVLRVLLELTRAVDTYERLRRRHGRGHPQVQRARRAFKRSELWRWTQAECPWARAPRPSAREPRRRVGGRP